MLKYKFFAYAKNHFCSVGGVYMNIRELLRGVVPLRIKGELPSDISSLSCDSRRTEKGSLFFCLGGIDLEGDALLPEAAAHGAAAVVASHPLESPLPQIIVSSPRAAYAAAWNNISRRPGERLRLLAVTGTNGKTSVTYLLRSIFRAAGISSSLIGTVGGDMTVFRIPMCFTLCCHSLRIPAERRS